MSSSFLFFGNSIVYPKFNIWIVTKSGDRIHFDSNFLKWYLFTSLLIGGFITYRLFKRISIVFLNFYNMFKPLQLKNRNLAIIFGFGDSIASIKLTKALITLGFNLILINKQKVFDYRKKKLSNKTENIEEINKTDCFLSYEKIFENPEILKKKIGNYKVDFLFDFTNLIFENKQNKIEENTNKISMEKYNNTLKEKESNFYNSKEIEVEDEKIKLTVKNSLSKKEVFAKLNKNVLKDKNDLTINSKEISMHINEFITITENLIPFMQETKIMIFIYKDKFQDIDYNLIVDYKHTFYSNLKYLADDKYNFISYAKIIPGLLYYKKNEFTEQDGINIIRFSDMENYKYSFV